MRIDEIISRVESLVESDMNTLRIVASGFGCDEMPTKAEASRVCAGLSKGYLVSLIIAHEFTDSKE